MGQDKAVVARGEDWNAFLTMNSGWQLMLFTTGFQNTPVTVSPDASVGQLVWPK